MFIWGKDKKICQIYSVVGLFFFIILCKKSAN